MTCQHCKDCQHCKVPQSCEIPEPSYDDVDWGFVKFFSIVFVIALVVLPVLMFVMLIAVTQK